MKLKKILLLPTLLTSLLTLASCANYRASPLCHPSPDLIQTAAPTKENITAVSWTFTKEDCYRFLDRNVIREGYQPVQIYIQNESERSYIFSLNRITLPIARPADVAETVHTSTVGRAVGYGIGALIVWPLAIPAVVDGIKSSQANDALDSDFAAKAARDQIIAPHSRLNAILFVPTQAYQESFSVTLIDQKTNKPKTFNLVSRG